MKRQFGRAGRISLFENGEKSSFPAIHSFAHFGDEVVALVDTNYAALGVGDMVQKPLGYFEANAEGGKASGESSP